jgi:hypothetical protein
MHLLRIERILKESRGSQFFQFQEMGHAVGASIPLVLGNGCRSAQQVMDLPDLQQMALANQRQVDRSWRTRIAGSG